MTITVAALKRALEETATELYASGDYWGAEECEQALGRANFLTMLANRLSIRPEHPRAHAVTTTRGRR